MKKTLVALFALCSTVAYGSVNGYTYVSGFTGFESNTSGAVGPTETTDGTQTMTLGAISGELTKTAGNSVVINSSHTAKITGGTAAVEAVNYAGTLIILTLSDLTANTTEQLLCSNLLGGWSFNYTVDTTNGLKNATIKVYSSGSSSSTSSYTSTITGVDLSGNQVSLALGYSRPGGSTGGYVYAMSSNDYALKAATPISGYTLSGNAGKPFHSFYFGDDQVISGLSGLSAATYNLDDFYAYSVNTQSAIQESDVKTLLMAAPEPATATLSLLALAGLAARRRRH